MLKDPLLYLYILLLSALMVVFKLPYKRKWRQEAICLTSIYRMLIHGLGGFTVNRI
jgi:hypothetical protein